jgi:hypothetical protein
MSRIDWPYFCCMFINGSLSYPSKLPDMKKQAHHKIRGRSQVAARSYGVGLWPSACWGCRFESRRGHGCLSFMSVMCCQVEVSAPGWSLVQRSPTECGLPECHREASIMRRHSPSTGCCAIEKIITYGLITESTYTCVFHYLSIRTGRPSNRGSISWSDKTFPISTESKTAFGLTHPLGPPTGG